MATGCMKTVFQHLRQIALRQDGGRTTDGQLLESFTSFKDEAAFAALVQRHGSMVLGVCYRVLRNHHDAEDAFQATFLVLARKASSVRPREQVANWLHGVAYRTALKARAIRAKSRMREQQVTYLPEIVTGPLETTHDMQPLLDQEISRLPEIYRLPFLLCALESRSIKEATQQLGWPQGTLTGRLARAKKMLARRLTQRGVALSGGWLAAQFLKGPTSTYVSPSLAASTVKAAVALAADKATGMICANVAALMEGVQRTMMLTKIKKVMAVVLMLGVAAIAVGLLACSIAAADQDERLNQSGNGKKTVDDARKNDVKPTVPDAESRLSALKVPGPWTVILGNCKVVIVDRSKMRITVVKTEKGHVVRLEIPGVTVEDQCLTMESETKKTEITSNAEGQLRIREYLHEPDKVGQIMVFGNNKTPTSEILQKLNSSPGQELDERALKKGEQDLASLHAAITVIDDNENPHLKHILVRVKE